MSKTQGKVAFYLKDSKTKGTTSVIGTFCYNKMQMKYYEPKLSINPKYWNNKEQKAREVKEFPFSSFNANLKALANTILDEYQKLKNDNGNLEPTTHQLKEKISFARNRTGPTQTRLKQDLFSFLEAYLDEIYKKVNPVTGKQISPITIRAYKQTFKLLKEYKTHSNKLLDFIHVDTDFYNSFIYFLTHTKGFKLNTVGKHVRNIKTFMQEALDRNYTTNINFKKRSFRVVSEKTDAIFLNESELSALEELDLSHNPRLDRVRDLFLVGCHSALRFGDLSKIEAYNIKDNYIEIEQQKTGSKVFIPIHPAVRRILEKYKDTSPNSLPKAVSNQKMNVYLKEITPMLSLLHEQITTGNTIRGSKVFRTFSKHALVTTHTARRSFASNQYLKGIPSYDIMKITGHKTERSFLRYLKIENKDAAIRINNFWQKESNALKVPRNAE